MSIKKKVSVSHAIQTALDNMNAQETNDSAIYKVWAIEGDRKIGSFYAYKRKIAVLHVHHCTADLPCEAVAVIGLMLGDHGCDCGLIFNRWYGSWGGGGGRAQVDTNAGFIVIDPYGGGNGHGSGGRWHIQGNHIIMEGNYHDSKITIEYLAYEEDELGFPLINLNHEDAIAQYIEYKHALRTRWFDPKYKISEAAIMDMRKEWNRKARHARAEDGDPSVSELHEVTSMINNPLSGIGIALWKYNDIYWGR